MRMYDLIEKKKRGGALTGEEIAFMVRGFVDGEIPDYQMAAMLMAVYFEGMTDQETTELTMEMARSGDMADLTAIRGVKVDKHSTGGVGDKTTLIVGPIVASLGVRVAKMSGRGLGHTGGTIDKLESIPGFKTDIGPEEFAEIVNRVGIAVIGQSGNMVPADKKLYALRDVTATVDSLPLIASSIVSKKLASGAQGVVLDVKTGAGALMHTTEASIELAQTMVRIGCDAGRRMMALVTDMGEPLGSHVGNALEVKEAIDALSGRVQGPLLEVSLELGARMLILADAAASVADAKQKLMDALESGRGLDRLRAMIKAQGGDPACCDDVTRLPQAPVVYDVPAAASGYVQRMDTVGLGSAAQAMGAGRRVKTDVIDPAVGFVMCRRIGDRVEAGEALATVHARDEATAQAASEAIVRCVAIGAEPSAPCKLIHAIVTNESVERL